MHYGEKDDLVMTNADIYSRGLKKFTFYFYEFSTNFGSL
jgi:hypothetical protein